MKINLVHRDSLSCEAILRIAPDGHLFIASQCGGNTEPDIKNKVAFFHSFDDGDTWTKKQLLIDDDKRAYYLTEVAVYDNNIDIFIIEHDGAFLYPECYIMRSVDNGFTFNRVEITSFNKNDFVFLRSFSNHLNKKMYAYQYYDLKDSESKRLRELNLNILKSDIEYSLCGIIYEEDGVYKKGNPVKISNKDLWQWPEPTVARLKDDSLVMLLRVNGSGYLYKSVSSDNGMNWSEPIKTDIPNPNNKPKLINIDDGRIALINTPNSNIGMKYRNPLEIWISSDDMKTWEKKIRILDFPSSYLSYPDGVYSKLDNKIKFAFELNRHDIYYVDVEL